MRALLTIFFVLSVPGRSLSQVPSITVQSAVLRLGMTRAEVVSELSKQTSLYLSI
jgi:hypothetical protein